MVEASHIVVRVPEGMAAKDAAVKRELLLQAVRKAIVEGKMTFEQAAKQYSEDESGSRGGAIGCFGRRFSTEEAFAKAAFALPVGQISDVVQTGMGFHLINVTDRKPGTPSDFKAYIKEKVRLAFGGDQDQQIFAERRQHFQTRDRRCAFVEVRWGLSDDAGPVVLLRLVLALAPGKNVNKHHPKKKKKKKKKERLTVSVNTLASTDGSSELLNPAIVAKAVKNCTE